MGFANPAAQLAELDGKMLDVHEFIRVQKETQAAEMEWLKGVSAQRREAFPAVNQFQWNIGPAQGYAWDLKIVSVQLSAPVSQVGIYIGEQLTLGTTPGLTAKRQIGLWTLSNWSQALFTWSSHQVIMFPGEVLTIDATASGVLINECFAMATEVPAEQIGKLLV
ncbi:MAG: hypothetical protein M0030_04555 [Actinomycetota bacterium]|nr:hypothetical protein [Actinomycetota bacterium]